MKTIFKAAIIALGAAGALSAAPAVAQPYGYDGYYGNGYDDDDYGYCDEYGCPDDFYDQPIYYGQVYYDGDWFNGPIYYRDYYGRRQFWIHGGWRFSNQYRGGRFGAALGRGWYRDHSRDFAGRYQAWRGFGGGNRGYGNGDFGGSGRNYGNYRDYNQRSYGGQNSFQQNVQPYGGGSAGNDWRSRYGNRQGFGDRGYNQRGVQAQQPQAAPQAQPQERQGFGGDRMGRGGFGGGRGEGFGGQRSFAPQAQPQAQPQGQPAPQAQPQPQGDGGRRGGGGRGADGERGGGPRDMGRPPANRE